MALPETTVPGQAAHLAHHDALHTAYNQRPQELDYAETTTAVIATNSTSGGLNVVDAPGLTVSYDFDGVTPIMFEVYCHASSNHLDVMPLIVIRDAADNTLIAFSWGGAASKADHTATNRFITVKRRFTPPAGVKTYKVGIQYFGSAGGQVRMTAGAAQPAYIRITTVDVA